MVGGVVTVGVTGHLLMLLAIVVAMAVLGDLRVELCMPLALGFRKTDRIVRLGMVGVGQ